MNRAGTLRAPECSGDPNGISTELIGATGYGNTRPLIDGVAPADMVQNRRVDVVVLSDDNLAIRAALIPAAEAEKKAVPAEPAKAPGH